MALDSILNANVVIPAAGIIGILFAVFLLKRVQTVKVPTGGQWVHLDGSTKKPRNHLQGGNTEGLLSQNEKWTVGGNSQDSFEVTTMQAERMRDIFDDIVTGAKAFLLAEYQICFVFIVAFGAVIFVLVSRQADGWQWTQGGLTAASFVTGGATSIIAGYIGMMVAVDSNARTTCAAVATGPAQWKNSFNMAFCAGGVMGYSLTSLSLLVLFLLIHAFAKKFPWTTQNDSKLLFECIAGYGLGGSSIAMFGRVGGGIYTKAADVGADLAGKVVNNLPEDDPRNPATIADNVGDNVGDVAGMGSDLFGSFAEATCAALVVSAASAELVEGGFTTLMYPLIISAAGIVVCMVSSFIATDIKPVSKEEDVETVLKTQLLVTAVLMTIIMYPISLDVLPPTFQITRVAAHGDAADGVLQTFITSKNWHQNTNDTFVPSVDVTVEGTPLKAFFCVCCGLWAGCAIGFITEYFTSHSYGPTREVAYSCETGAATNIIYGLALGYKSAIIPVGLLSVVVYISFTLCDMYGVSLAALGMLGTLSCCLSIDVYGPVCDNAGGIAEMAGLHESVRDCTDALDAAGNTTAAIGKGFAIGSATLVGLALFGAFVTRSGLADSTTSILSPMVFAGLLLGAMIPYWFSAMTMKSVGVAANAMVKEVNDQFTSTWVELKAADSADDMKRSVDRQLQHFTTHFFTGATIESVRHKGFNEHWQAVMSGRGIEEDWVVQEPPLAQEYTERGFARDSRAVNLIMAKLANPSTPRCIKISTDASLREMVPPGLLVIGTPLVVGALFGTDAVAGLLAGAISSSVQLAISASNTGGSWDNAKKYVERNQVWLPRESADGEMLPLPTERDLEEPGDGVQPFFYCRKRAGGSTWENIGRPHDQPVAQDGEVFVKRVLHGKNTDVHKAAVAGDTVGDPLKDTSGPALNIVMKLMAILSLVFADFFVSINHGKGAFQLPRMKLELGH